MFLQDIVSPFGSPDCPCTIPAWNSSIYCSNPASNPQACFPDGLGHQCIQHSLYSEEQCQIRNGTVIPKWCFVAWCFVDKEKCFQSNFEYYRNEELRDDIGDLFYSIDTCGPLKEEWGTANFEAKTHPENFVFDAIIPAPEYPWSYFEDENGNVITDLDTELYWNNTGTYKGAIIDFIGEVTVRSAFSGFNLMPRSKGSDIREPNSTYTASVTDVTNKVGNVCVGNFWMTSERAAMIKYTVPLYYSPFYLYELNDKDFEKGLLEGINNVSSPFSDNLVYTLEAFLVLVGITTIVLLTSRGAYNEIFESLNEIQSKRISKFHKFLLKSRLQSTVIIYSFMNCFQGAAEPQGQSSSLPNKILAFGFGFFCLITQASYTANLANDLSRRGITGFIPNMKTVQEEKIVICAPWPLKNEFEKTWPDVKFVFINEIPYIPAAIEKLKSRDCAAIAAEHTEISTIVDVCDPEREGKAIIASIKVMILEVPIAFPIAPQHSSFLSQAILDAQLNGVDILHILKKYHRNMDCDVYPKSFYSNEENRPLTVYDLGGAFAPLIICMILAMCLKSTKGLRKKYWKKADRELKKRMSGVVEVIEEKSV